MSLVADVAARKEGEAGLIASCLPDHLIFGSTPLGVGPASAWGRALSLQRATPAEIAGLALVLIA